jgi:hypothetical protein
VPAKRFHKGCLKMEKAAMVVSCDLKQKTGEMVKCQVNFSVWYDRIVSCVTVHGDVERNRGRHHYQNTSFVDSDTGRQKSALMIQRLFMTPRDPFYHQVEMLTNNPLENGSDQTSEPRAVVLLNRFTYDLDMMNCTYPIVQVTGTPAYEMQCRSFYDMIAEGSRDHAFSVIDEAKANDGIAYLRFQYRDPRQDDGHRSDFDMESDSDADMESDSDADMADLGAESVSNSESEHDGEYARLDIEPPHELEAIIYCTSDGLVVCLRRAHPLPWANQDIRSEVRDFLWAAAPMVLCTSMETRHCVLVCEAVWVYQPTSVSGGAHATWWATNARCSSNHAICNANEPRWARYSGIGALNLRVL